MKGNRTTLGLGLCALGAVVLLSAAQCQKQQAPPDQSVQSDSARVVRLEREARALVKIEGCSSADQCRTAPVGDRPCGGPRDYVVYCARTTDTTTLNRKLAELREAEQELNRKSGAMSTCEFRMPPGTGIVNGACRAR